MTKMSKNTSETYNDRSAANESPPAQSSTPEPVATTSQFAHPPEFEYNSMMEPRPTHLQTRGEPSLNPAPTYQPIYSSIADPVTTIPQLAQPQVFDFDTMALLPTYLSPIGSEVDPALIDPALVDPVPTFQPMQFSTPELAAANSQLAQLPEIDYNTNAPSSPHLTTREGRSVSPTVQPQGFYANTLPITSQPVAPWRPQAVATTFQYGQLAESEFDAMMQDRLFGDNAVPTTSRYQPLQSGRSTRSVTRGGTYSNPWARSEDVDSELPRFSFFNNDERLNAIPAPPPSSPSPPVVQPPTPPPPTTTSRPERHKRKALRHGCKKCAGLHFQSRAIKSDAARRNSVEYHIRQSHPTIAHWQDLVTQWGHRYYYPSGRSEDVPASGQAASRRKPEGARAGAAGSSRGKNDKVNEGTGGADISGSEDEKKKKQKRRRK